MLPQLADYKLSEPAMPESPAAAMSIGPANAWSGWDLLQRRLSMLRGDARTISAHASLIGRALSQAE